MSRVARDSTETAQDSPEPDEKPRSAGPRLPKDILSDRELEDEFVVGEYFLGVEGLAILRAYAHSPAEARQRIAEIRDIVAKLDEYPQSLTIPTCCVTVLEGYSSWADHYDERNPSLDTEENVVHSLVAEIPPGCALDAACGTGRHAAALEARGHSVIGVDRVPAMLQAARKKVPHAEFRQGLLEALPVDDASVDVIVCGMALTHLPDLVSAFSEFARVLRPGGRLITSDIHPMVVLTTASASFYDEDSESIRRVNSFVHQIGAYVRAFAVAGLQVAGCFEPSITQETMETFPSYRTLPDATQQAFQGLPDLIVWDLTHS